MVELTRTVRFFLNDRPAPAPPRHNGFSAWPPARGLGRFYQMHLRCQGPIDPVTGYVVNIKVIDQVVRDHAIACLHQALDRFADDAVPMGQLLQDMMQTIAASLEVSLCQLRLELSPFHSLQIERDDMQHIEIAQQFQFSAAHRLSVPHFDDDQNRAVFGKCSNPSGHGHNYRLEVVVHAPIDPDGHVFRVEDLDALVNELVIEHFDHKHLNLDLPEFANHNPSVENITRVIFERLETHVEALGAQLDRISVWETAKTVCTFRKQQVESNV